MSLDGFAILKSVAGHAELFSEARDAADKAALNIIAAQFKAKTFDLNRLKRAGKALGADNLALVLEHLPDSIPKALLRRIDPYHPKASSGSAAWMRSHVAALAGGTALPEPKPQAPAKTKTDSKIKKKPTQEDDIIGDNFWATSVMARPARSSRTPRKSD
jgi:hypothetical protein